MVDKENANSTNIFDLVGDKKASVSTRVKKTVSDHLVYIMLIFVISVQVVSELYTVSLQNIFSVGYFLDMSVNIATTMLIYVVFIPVGNKKELDTSLSYKYNSGKWSELSERVRNGRNGEFSEFCKKREEGELEDRRRSIILSNTMLTFATYCSEYKGLRSKALKKKRKNGEITPREYRAIKKANSRMRIRPINPLLILCGVEGSCVNDAGRANDKNIVQWFVRRPIVILVTNVLINSIVPSYRGIQDLDAIYAMLLSCLGTVMSAFVGYSVGISKAKARADAIRNRILFIESFEEYEKRA